MPVASDVVDAIEAALVAQGLPSEITQSVLVAIDAAGFELTPQEGGDPIVVVDRLTPTIKGVVGLAGVYIYSVDVGGGSTVSWVEHQRPDEKIGRTGVSPTAAGA